MFFRFENQQLYCNSDIIGDLSVKYKEQDGWYWFNSPDDAVVFFQYPDYSGTIVYTDR